MTKDERIHMNKLSKEVFGTTSRWQKVMKHGERITITSKNKKGEEIEVGYYVHPTLEEMREGLEHKALEMVNERKLKESKANGKSIGLPGESSSTSGSTEGSRPSGSPTSS